MDNNALLNCGLIGLSGSSIITAPEITGSVNDWAPTGIQSANVVKVITTGQGANSNITGIEAPNNDANRFLSLVFISNGRRQTDVVLNSGSSLQQNRIVAPGNTINTRNDVVINLWYDFAVQKWRVMSYTT